MTDVKFAIDEHAITDRECGDCSACCVHLTIDQKELQKPAGVACEHLAKPSGCSIYESRPSVCRTWNCAWRILPWLDDSLRPDKAGLIICVHRGEKFGLEFLSMGNKKAFFNPKILQIVGACIEGDFPVFISVPTRPGYCSARCHLNVEMKTAAKSHELGQMIEGMKAAYAHGEATFTNIQPLLKAHIIAPKSRLTPCPCGSGKMYKKCHGTLI